MRETKFRQPIWMDGKFAYWHYWGFVKRGEFTGPGYHAEKALEESQQFTGRRDSKRTEEFPEGQEIYAGDQLSAPTSPTYTVVWSDIEARWCMTGESRDGGFQIPLTNGLDFLRVIGTIHDKEVSNEKN